MFRRLSVYAGVPALIAALVLLTAEPGRAVAQRGGVGPGAITPNIQGAARFAVPQSSMAPGFQSGAQFAPPSPRFNPGSIYAPPSYDPSRLYPYYSYNYNYGLYPYYNRRDTTYSTSSGYGELSDYSEYTQAYPGGTPSYGERSFPGGASAERARAERFAHLTVNVPPGAEVWFDQHKTSSTGTVREFQTPPLSPGKYGYTVKARWQEDGHEVTQSRDVVVSPGSDVQLNFPLPRDGQGDKGSSKER
jgi:uncharacterized protein (TIGR03000 family)